MIQPWYFFGRVVLGNWTGFIVCKKSCGVLVGARAPCATGSHVVHLELNGAVTLCCSSEP